MRNTAAQRPCMVSVVLVYVCCFLQFDVVSSSGWVMRKNKSYSFNCKASHKAITGDGDYPSSEATGDTGFQELVIWKENRTGFARKLLTMDDDDGGGGGSTINRIGGTCSKDNIVIFQGSTTPLPNGVPTYTVQVVNVCVSGCSVSNIHLSCGWFSSSRMINPRVFRRACYNDCLVNDGEALDPGESLSFQYANNFS